MTTESGFVSTDLAACIREQMARWSVPGVVVGVLRDGARDVHAYGVASLETGYAVRPDTLFPIGSISKVYTAALAVTLVDEGALDLDAPVITYLPDLALADTRARATITLRHLLTHRSGLYGDYYDDFGMGDDALARCVASFASLRQLSAPGELWTYCSAGFMLAGRAVEVVTGQSFEVAMRERIFTPLGLDRSFFSAQEAIVYPTAVGHTPKAPRGDEHEVCRTYLLPRNVAPAGGVISDANDLLTFAAFFMGDGDSNGRRVLSPAALAAMLAPQTRAASFPAAGFAEWGGLGWAIRIMGGEMVVENGGALSGFRVKLKFVPARRFAIAILTNGEHGDVLGDRVGAWALEHALGLRTCEPAHITLPDDALARFSGRYRGMDGLTVTLSVADGGLRRIITEAGSSDARELTYPPSLLKPVADLDFIVVTRDENEGAHLDFIEDANGAIRFLRIDGRLYDRIRADI